ncbi:hypothetical protein PMIN06_011605 [Paraphaeosphaeria minitans]
MSAWGKVNRVERTEILFMGDTKSWFSKKHVSDAGRGNQNGKWAMVIDRDGTVKYADDKEEPTEVTVRLSFY